MPLSMVGNTLSRGGREDRSGVDRRAGRRGAREISNNIIIIIIIASKK